MSRILVIYYSQSGDVERCTEAFLSAFEEHGHEITIAPIESVATHPYPWRSLRRFFDAMPETVLGITPPIQPPAFTPGDRFDLVVIAYPIWFLSPAPAVQSLFRADHVAVLRDANVVTLTVCRAMWHRGYERMQALLAEAGARHIGHLVVTHQGSPLATFVSTPRALLWGRRDRLMGVFPEPGTSVADLARLRRIGACLADHLMVVQRLGPLTSSFSSVTVQRPMIVPELVGFHCFRAWARSIHALGGIHPVLRTAGVYSFAVFLALLVLFALPLTLLGTLALRPLLAGWLERRASALMALGTHGRKFEADLLSRPFGEPQPGARHDDIEAGESDANRPQRERTDADSASKGRHTRC